jgi:hypothetical protein
MNAASNKIRGGHLETPSFPNSLLVIAFATEPEPGTVISVVLYSRSHYSRSRKGGLHVGVTCARELNFWLLGAQTREASE